MALHIVSLIRKDSPQEIRPNTYTLVRFPYTAESYDAEGMHQAKQPDGTTVTNWQVDNRSGLIWPVVDGWGALEANIMWEPGKYTELRDRFDRDPLGEARNPTGYDHRPPSPGNQCFTKYHGLFVKRGTPLGLLVSHNDTEPRMLTHAQFKLTIWETR